MEDSLDADVMMQFDRCAPYLTAALRHGEVDYNLDDIRERCADGRFQFWPGLHCAAVTSISEYPQRKVLFLNLLGGDMREFSRLWPEIAAWARAQGCTSASAHGRPGWSRHLLARDAGWRPSQQILLEHDLWERTTRP